MPLSFNIWFLPSFVDGPAGTAGYDALFPFNTPAWSLFFELAVNIVWFVLLPFLTTRRLVVLCLCAAIIRVAGHQTSVALGLDEFWAAIWDATSRTPYCFFVGVAVFRVWRSGTLLIKVPMWVIVALMLMVYALPPYPMLHAIEILLPLPVLLAANRDPPQRLVPACVVLGNMSYAI